MQPDGNCKALVERLLCSKPGRITEPNSLHPGHCFWRCCNSDADVWRAAAMFGKGDSKVLEAAHVLELYCMHVDLCFVVAVGVNCDFILVSTSLYCSYVVC